MRLGIISDARHYYDEAGRLCTLAPVARQFEQWAALFDTVTVCAPFLPGPPPDTHIPYEAANIKLLPIASAGGDSVSAKLDLLWKAKDWAMTVRRLLREVDAVHIRCPNNISIIGLPLLLRYKGFKQAVYTGAWQGYAGEPRTYRWQRWFLRTLFRGPVAVYGAWPDQPAHITPTFSPSYSEKVWQEESSAVAEKTARLRNSAVMPQPLKLLSVGALTSYKNQRVVIQAVHILAAMDIKAELSILGAGELLATLREQADQLGVGAQVHLVGAVSAAEVRRFYRMADFIVQPSHTEGFSKAPVEALFHGVTPLLSDLEVNRQIVGEGKRGRFFQADDAQAIAKILAGLLNKPAEVADMIDAGRAYARACTLEAWRQHIRAMLENHWRLELTARDRSQANAR